MLRAILILAGTILALSGAELHCVGVLGNSGEQGPSLARYSEKRAGNRRDGMGAVLDRFGTLWERNGSGRLNRFTLDGRLVQSVEIGGGITHLDLLSLVDDQLVIRIRDSLAVLDVAAPETGTRPLELRVESISRRGHGGRLAVVVDAKRLAWLDPVSAATSEIAAPLEAGELSRVEVLEDGSLLVTDKDKQVWAQGDGAWSRFAKTGGAIHPADGALWTFGWHGTIKRFDRTLEPDPGVVLGGASGSFIGHLAGNYEVNHPLSIAAAGPELYLIGGMGGVSHLARWNGTSRALELVRRIGAIDDLRGGLALDAEGRVRIPTGVWDWTAAPDTPLRLGDGIDGNGQWTLLPSGAVAGSCYVYGDKPAMCYGPLAKELGSTYDRWAKEVTFPKTVTGCSLVPGEDRRLLRVSPDGQVLETQIDHVGKPQKDLAVGTIRCEPPVGRITTLAVTADQRLLAGADGVIVELVRGDQEGDWVEASRWDRVGDLSFGGELHIAAHAGRLWIGDTAGHRVICASEDLRTVHARFGGETGDDLEHCDRPTTVAAYGNRAVVYDAGNQRLLKLELR